MISILKRTGRMAAKLFCSRAFLGMLLALVTTVTVLTSAAAANTVTIYDGTDVKTIKTFSTDADEILSTAGIKLDDADEFTAEKLGDRHGVITVQRAFDVTVTYGNEKLTAKIADGTVADVLEKLNITVGEHDILSAELTDPATAGMFVDIISVDYNTSTAEETIEPATDIVYSDDLYEGETQITEGKPGVKLVTYKNKLVNGTIAESTAVSETVLTEPINAVKTVGTKKQAVSAGTTTVNTAKPSKGAKWYSSLNTVSTLQPDADFELDENNVPVNYKKLITGKATAYFETGLTATGKQCRPGYVAVNPRQIPYGSKLYVKTPDNTYIYGFCSAEDTGGFVSWGTVAIDLFFPTNGACYTFGVRNVEIYVLD